MSETLIRSMEPRREWLLRCSDIDHQLAVCSIGVSNGQIEIYGPEGELIELDGSEIADFRTALDSAIELAEADLRAKRSAK
jgi:hypothetical protein